MRQKFYATLAGEWGTLLENSRVDLAAMPHAASVHASLEASLESLVGLNEQVEAERARLQVAVNERKQLVNAGRKQRNALVRLLLAQLGDEDQRLVRYGLRPRVTKRRTKKAETEATATANDPSKVQSAA